MYVNDNSDLYNLSPFDREKSNLHHQLFPVEVLTVDYERRVLTVQDIQTQSVFSEVTIFPTNSSSFTSTDINMPEPGSIGMAMNWQYEAGFRQIAIVSWINSGLSPAVDAIAQRAIEGDLITGWTDRIRGTYRKAFPGQKTVSYTEGYTERLASGWDRSGSDYSRDKLDPERRDWMQLTGRKVSYTDAGVSMSGAVNRPGATSLIPVTQPDGTQQYVAYLQPGSQPSDRYVSGKPDVIPYSEQTELIQEFALDYAVPFEVLQTALLDSILGTTASPWNRTTVTSPQGQVAFDSETFMITQTWDHPNNTNLNSKVVGPTLAEGATPQRRGYILERSAGTLVGYNQFDPNTYGLVLKPQLFVGTPKQPTLGKFGSSVESGYNQVVDSIDHIEARLAASCLAVRFAYEQNTTRLNVTKEGLVQMEIGATLPKENIPLQPKGSYEYPYGAGRSLEAHLVGSAKMVIGKNRDEEEALDAQILGQTVLRLGADDTSAPNARRTVQTQIRSRKDLLGDRELQYWQPKSKLGDAGSLTNKTGMENISLRAAFDGGTVIRLGGRDPQAKRRHLKNGYVDAPGKTAYSVGDSARVDSKSYRADYGAGDSLYQFHDLTQAGSAPNAFPPYSWSGSPVTSTTIPSSPMDSHGLSLDMHAVRDILLRVGANTDSNQSILLDTAGGIVLGLGKDKQGRSITGTLDGAIEIVIKPNTGQRAIQLSIVGDIDVTHMGNIHWLTTGDGIFEYTAYRRIVKTDVVTTQQKRISSSLTRDTTEAPDIVHNQGFYQSDENS
jgi:hypothetical protein